MTDSELKWIEDALGLMISQEGRESGKIKILADQFHSFEEYKGKRIIEYIMENCGAEVALGLSSIFIENEEREEIWNELIHVIIEGTFECYYAAMIELQIRVSHKMNAKNYLAIRELHRKNARRFQEEFSLEVSYTPVRERNHRRLCIVTEQILDLNHAPTRCVLDLAYATQKYLNYEMIVFSIPSNLRSPKLRYCSANMQLEGKTNLAYRDINIRIWQISLNSKDRRGYCDLLKFMAEWKPYFVLQVGTFNPIAEIPLLFNSLVAMNLSLGCPPISDAGILVRLNRETDEEEQLYEAAMQEDQIQFLYNKKMPVLIQKSGKSIWRHDLGLPDDKFLMAIVGNRFDREVDVSFLAIMERVVSQETRASLVFIGEKVPEKLLGESRLDGHIYRIGYQEDLMAAYSCMDLYVNPKRQGGGGSAVMALMAGVPVVTLPGGDVAWNVGVDFTVADERQMEEEILRYIRDEEFYKTKQKLAYEHAKQNNEEELAKYAKGLMDGIIGLLEEQERRRLAGV